jgi:hypothetical protein
MDISKEVVYKNSREKLWQKYSKQSVHIMYSFMAIVYLLSKKMDLSLLVFDELKA